MPQPHIPCPGPRFGPNCPGSIKVRKSGTLYAEERTGLLVRECLVSCDTCGRNGKMLVTLDIALYLDDSEGLHVDQTPFPNEDAA